MEIVHTDQGRTYQGFFYFNILLHGIQDGFDFSFRNKEKFFYFQLSNIWRLSEVIKIIFKKWLYLMY